MYPQDEQKPKTVEEILKEQHAQNKTEVGWYYRLTKIKSMVEGFIKPLNAQYKADMIGKKETERPCGSFKLVIGEQDRSTLNHDKAIALLKEKRLAKHAVKKVEVLDEDAFTALVTAGKIKPQEVKDCMNENIIKTLSVKEIKEAAKNG